MVSADAKLDFKDYLSYPPVARMKALFDLASTPWMSANFEEVGKISGGGSPVKLELDDMHRAVGSPVFCHSHGLPETLGEEAGYAFKSDVYRNEASVVANPILSSIDLQKMIDPFTAFHEIERYLTNQLAPRDLKRDWKVIEKAIPDKVKAESHGFDKHSFRKDPSGKKSKKGR